MITDFVLGEVQQPDMPTSWHAVQNTAPGAWGVAICPDAPRVWVHEVAGAAIPFPGVFEDRACQECKAKVAAARPSPAEQLAQERRRWTRLIWRRNAPS